MSCFTSRLLPAVRFGERLGLTIAHLLAITLIAWPLLRLYSGDRWLPVRLGSYFAPWLFMALLPALTIALLRKRRRLTGLLLLLIAVFGIQYWPLFIPTLPRASAEAATTELRVMTFNVHYANRRSQDIAHLIRTENPDVVALQEVTGGLARLLRPELVSDYPYFLVDNHGGFPRALLSRYPLLVDPSSPDVPQAQPATLVTPAGNVLIWNVHPPPAVGRRGWEAQRYILAGVANAVSGEDRPLIVLGDFNTTPQAENFGLIANQLTDVHQAAGRGFGFTFPEPAALAVLPWYLQPARLLTPVVRIDHILVNDRFTPLESYVAPIGYGSDHRPVVATLRFVDQ